MTMIASDNCASLPFDQASLPDTEDADLVLLLPDGDRVRLEWHHEEPQIDAVVPMEVALG
jgi:hypothetical protein